MHAAARASTVSAKRALHHRIGVRLASPAPSRRCAGTCRSTSWTTTTTTPPTCAPSPRPSGMRASTRTSDDRLLFSYHSIPLADIEAGDTYELQVGASSLQIAGELGLDRNRWTIGYQCRFDKGREWLSPFTTRRAGALGRGGRRGACSWCARTSPSTAWRRSTTWSTVLKPFYFDACLREAGPRAARGGLRVRAVPRPQPRPREGARRRACARYLERA